MLSSSLESQLSANLFLSFLSPPMLSDGTSVCSNHGKSLEVHNQKMLGPMKQQTCYIQLRPVFQLLRFLLARKNRGHWPHFSLSRAELIKKLAVNALRNPILLKSWLNQSNIQKKNKDGLTMWSHWSLRLFNWIDFAHIVFFLHIPIAWFQLVQCQEIAAKHGDATTGDH